MQQSRGVSVNKEEAMGIKRVGLVGLLALLVSGMAMGAQEWDFSSIDRIELEGVSGDVILLPANGRGGRVELRENVTPRGNFEPTVEEHGGTLEIQEKWQGRSSRGEVEWTIYLPTDGVEIEISTASGSLSAENIDAHIDLSTASGDVELIDVELDRRSSLSTSSGTYTIEDMRVSEDVSFSTASGDILLSNVEIDAGVSFSTASGDVECNGCRGHLTFSSASGDVVVKNSSMDGPGKFSSASGDVRLHLDESPRDGLSASSASGDVVLDGDLGRNYTLVMTAREDKGRIVSPFENASRRTFHRNGHTYEEKVVEQGSGGPEIHLSTASGAVVVKD
jgi:DUF4097 and DUF4098 domain-containing protein YvlB